MAIEQERTGWLHQLLGCAFIILLGYGAALPFRLAVCDILAPLFAFSLFCDFYLDRLQFRPKHIFLLGFLLYALIAVITHICGGGAILDNGFEWIVFAYGVMLYDYYDRHPLNGNVMLLLGGAILLLFTFCWGVDALRMLCSNDAHPWFSQVYEKMTATKMSFLSSRYSFTFSNPNLAAPYCGLGALLLSLGIRNTQRKWPWLILLFFSCIGMAFTYSKHAILFFAALLYCVYQVLADVKKWRRWLCCSLAVLALLAAIALCETTVLFVTFPLSRKAPFINTQPGMYTIHQQAYLKMLPKRFWLGYGSEQIKEQYPLHVDKSMARDTLKHYNSEKDVESFCQYMDPHCEWLNLPILFGVPALVMMVLFLVFSSQGGVVSVLWILAVLGCMLWDDELSKRWIWVGLGLVSHKIVKNKDKCQTMQNRSKK